MKGLTDSCESAMENNQSFKDCKTESIDFQQQKQIFATRTMGFNIIFNKASSSYRAERLGEEKTMRMVGLIELPNSTDD